MTGLVLTAIGLAVAVLIASLKHKELWVWYEVIRERLAELEIFIAEIPQRGLFILAIFLLFAVKCFVPIYLTSSVCFLTGLVLPMYLAIPVNILGLCIMLSVKYLWGFRFGGGMAWRIISRSEHLRKVIEQDGSGNPWLLVMLRLVPTSPINAVSSVYGSLDFGYWKFMLLSIIGFMPRLVSFTFVGRSAYDPLSAQFLVPIMIISLLTGISLLGINGVWLLVERVVSKTKNDGLNAAEEGESNGEQA